MTDVVHPLRDDYWAWSARRTMPWAGCTLAMASRHAAVPRAEPGAKRGGKLRVGEMVARMEDPATYKMEQRANQTRPILEY